MKFLYAVKKGFVRQTVEGLPYEMADNYIEVKFVEIYPVPTLIFVQNNAKANASEYDLLLLENDILTKVSFDDVVKLHQEFSYNENEVDKNNTTESTRTISFYSGNGIKTIFKNTDSKSYKFKNLYQAKLFDNLYNLANANSVVNIENLRNLKDAFYIDNDYKKPNNELFNFFADSLKCLLSDFQGKDANVYKNAISILRYELAAYGEYLKNKDYIEKVIEGAFWCFEVKSDKPYADFSKLKALLANTSFVRDEKIGARIDLTNPYIKDFYLKSFETFYDKLNLRVLNKTALTEYEMNNFRKVMLENTKLIFNTKIFVK